MLDSLPEQVNYRRQKQRGTTRDAGEAEVQTRTLIGLPSGADTGGVGST